MESVYQAERDLWNQPGSPSQPFEKRLVEYGQVNGRRLPGTLYRPRQRPAGGKAVVFVHGGGWWEGDRGQFARHSAWLTGRGVTSLCISYRLSTEARYPACVQDAKCAVRWMRRHADELGIDPNRIVVSGSSAGAHIAALVVTSSHDDPYAPTGGSEDVSGAVAGGVLYNGIFRIPVDPPDRLQLQALVVLLGAEPDQQPALYREASPLYRVDGHTPPCLLLHGDADAVVSHRQSLEFVEALQRHGRHGEVEIYPGIGHGQLNQPPTLMPCLERMVDFLDRQL